MPTTLRRFLLWTFVCWASAAPSFVLAHQQYDTAAMVTGVFLFVGVYTALTSTAAFARFHRRPFVRRTLYVGYGTRVVISILYPIAMFPDIIAGATSIGIVKNVTGLEPTTFAGTLLTTCVSGTLLNLTVFAFMGVVYAFQRAFMKPPVGSEPQGFAVILNTPPAEPVPLAPTDPARGS